MYILKIKCMFVYIFVLPFKVFIISILYFIDKIAINIIYSLYKYYIVLLMVFSYNFISLYSDSNHTLQVEEEALTTLAEMCDGDARCALNGLQLAIQTKQALLSKPKPSAENTLKKFPTPKPQLSNSTDNPNSCTSSSKLSESGDTESSITKKATITVQDVKESLQRSHLLYDRAGDEHYNIISALHKSMRGGDGNASLYWLARMLCAGEDPLYVARRVVRFASEDIGECMLSYLTWLC